MTRNDFVLGTFTRLFSDSVDSSTEMADTPEEQAAIRQRAEAALRASTIAMNVLLGRGLLE